MRGAHPKSITEREAQGSQRRPRSVAPVTVLLGVPNPPKYFNAERGEIWRRTCRALIEMKNLTLQSLDAVECHVNAMINMRVTVMDKRSKNTARASAIDQARKSADLLGLSPTSHARLHVPKQLPGSAADKSLEDMVA